jgi:hypothetical protein
LAKPFTNKELLRILAFSQQCNVGWQGSVAKFVSFSDNWPILVIEKPDDQF